MTKRTSLLISTAAIGYDSDIRATVEAINALSSDSILKRSKDSAAMLPYWDKVDAVIDGIDGLRGAREDYLPRFPDESQREYDLRLQCTKVTNVYRDVTEGLASKPFEQSVTLVDDETTDATVTPDSITKFSYDVDGSGNNLTVFAASTFFNGINAAIDWIMVDHSKRDPSIRTVADAARAGLRPYWSHVLGRNVLDVQSKVINGDETLTFMKILEPGDPDHVREFTRADDGSVTWKLYRKTTDTAPNGKPAWVVEDSGDITIGMIPLVPFITGRRDGRNWKFYPAMKDAVDLQVELYQQESGLKFAKTLTAYPMLAANGIAPPKGPDGKPDKNVAVGPNRILWATPDAQGKVGNWAYVEPGSESLKFLADDIERTIQQLRELGRQPLTASTSNITVITAAVAAGKARSAVKAWAYNLKDTLENALVMTAKWMGIPYDPMVHVFVDFDDWMEADDLPSLDADRDRGDISRLTLWEEKQRRGVYSSNFTAAREEKRLLDEIPSDGPDMTGAPPA